MKVLSIILGVIMVLCGFGCIIRPGETFLASGYMLAILLLIYGFEKIISAFIFKRFGLDFALGIISAIIGVFAIFRPESTLAIDAFLIYALAFYFIVQGVISIVMAINMKKIVTGMGWILGLVIGIIGVILGIYSFVHPMTAALTIGILVGFYFIESGINMIVFAASRQ